MWPFSKKNAPTPKANSAFKSALATRFDLGNPATLSQETQKRLQDDISAARSNAAYDAASQVTRGSRFPGNGTPSRLPSATTITSTKNSSVHSAITTIS